MISEITYSCLDRPDHPDWAFVAPLFEHMYEQMDEMGLLLGLAEGGTEKWIKTVSHTTGKFGIVYLAREDGKPVGFAHGMVKFLPDYLGGFPVGSITHVFVDKKVRRKGIGQELVRLLEYWFGQKNVHSTELQVISGNLSAVRFWEKLGYMHELHQYRKI